MEKMTYEEFIVKLSMTPRDWCLNENSMIRYGHPDEREYHCPVTFVFRDSPQASGDYLGEKLRAAIVNAADNWHDYDPKIREDLLTACGLKGV
jgi:hypothetical protein